MFTLACRLFELRTSKAQKTQEEPLNSFTAEKEFKIEGLFQEVAITIDDYRKVYTQCHREEPSKALLIKVFSVSHCL